MVKSVSPLLALSLLLVPMVGESPAQLNSSTERPNILWITSEDTGPQIGCYGDHYADTPNIDSIAARGMIYLNCWSNAPVCAPARTTIITGCYPNSLGAQHMRSQVATAEPIRLYPLMFRELGYYCSNNAKEDYNLLQSKEVWDESSNRAHWRKRKPGQPFFSVFNFTTSHESQIRKRPHTAIHDPEKVSIPPYHPDTPESRQDWAQYYDKVTEMDQQVGQVLGQLKQDGLADSTIVFYYGDHGSGMPRSKRWLYQSGLHVPLIVHVPERYRELVGKHYQPQSRSTRLVSFVDLVPTMLSIMGSRPPAHLQGKAFLGKFAEEDPEYVYGFRDRMDERYDMSRAVRDQRFHYIRNFMPHRPQGTYLNYMFQTPTTQAWHRLFEEGKLTEAQSAFFKSKPVEELYDIQNDPYEIHNLAAAPEHAQTLDRMRKALQTWMVDIRDLGLLPEGEVLSRASGTAPYSFARQTETGVNTDQLMKIAEIASSTRSLDGLLSQKMPTDSAARYWIATGLLVRAQAGSERDACVKAARSMAGDPSPYVRATVNEILARFGAPTDRGPAIHALVDLCDLDKQDLFVALFALNSLDWSQPLKSEIGEAFTSLPVRDKRFPPRYQEYIARMKERIIKVAGN